VGESTSNLVACRIGEDVRADDDAAGVLLGEDGIACADTLDPLAGARVEAPLVVRFCAVVLECGNNEDSNGVVAFFSDNLFVLGLVPLAVVGLSPVHNDDDLVVRAWAEEDKRSLEERLGRGRSGGSLVAHDDAGAWGCCFPLLQLSRLLLDRLGADELGRGVTLVPLVEADCRFCLVILLVAAQLALLLSRDVLRALLLLLLTFAAVVVMLGNMVSFSRWTKGRCAVKAGTLIASPTVPTTLRRCPVRTTLRDGECLLSSRLRLRIRSLSRCCDLPLLLLPLRLDSRGVPSMDRARRTLRTTTPASSSSCGASIGLSDRLDDSWLPLLQLLLACNTSISQERERGLVVGIKVRNKEESKAPLRPIARVGPVSMENRHFKVELSHARVS
jgi:hypothetical protein